MGRLEGRRALVIGSRTGIGRAVAVLFAQEGADVAVADNCELGQLTPVADEIRAVGRRAITLQVDVRVEEQVRNAVLKAIGALGHIDIMVNNAGIAGPLETVQQLSATEWDHVISVDLRGVFLGLKHILPHMVSRGYGRVINTSSQLAHKPAPLTAAYCAAKAGVVALTASVAQEVIASGVTVNNVAPGPTDTPMWNRPGSEEWNQSKLSGLPAKRVAQPMEIAAAYLFLASDDASYMVGQTVSPNGGDVMW